MSLLKNSLKLFGLFLSQVSLNRNLLQIRGLNFKNSTLSKIPRVLIHIRYDVRSVKQRNITSCLAWFKRYLITLVLRVYLKRSLSLLEVV